MPLSMLLAKATHDKNYNTPNWSIMNFDKQVTEASQAKAKKKDRNNNKNKSETCA